MCVIGYKPEKSTFKRNLKINLLYMLQIILYTLLYRAAAEQGQQRVAFVSFEILR